MAPADSNRPRAARRKDRLVQTRVPRDLETTLKREANRRRLTVSHLIRNILEDTFQLVDDVVANVDDIVTDSVELARRVGRDARRVADAMRDAVAEPPAGDRGARVPREPGDAAAEASATEEAPDSLAHVYAWNAVVLNRAARCARCDTEMERGGEGFVGLSDEPSAPRTWLCVACREAL